jgi:hypothetical protein
MTIAAIVPALQLAGGLATLASSVASALTGSSGDTASGAAGSSNGIGSNRMEHVLKRQEAMQLKAMEMQTEANIQKIMADTANSIASGHLDSGVKAQNASIKAAQGIHF